MSDTKQVALVTGASRGIGRAIATTSWPRRASPSSAPPPPMLAQPPSPSALAPHGGRGLRLDVNDAAAVDAAIDAIVKADGGLQVLVNNAGITRDTLAMRMKDADWDAVIDTNLKAVFRCSRAVLRPMMKQRHGRIINITSVVGASGNAGQANYAAAKAGVAGMTRALARELGSRNITVNCMCPRLHRHRHDGRTARGPEGRAAGPDPAGPAGHARGDRPCGGLPGQPAGRLHHRHRAACQRRHVHELKNHRRSWARPARRQRKEETRAAGRILGCF
jgi:3-oxoacyl-[acyl-carrier protein] reductase